jgi:hypothetical protein
MAALGHGGLRVLAFEMPHIPTNELCISESEIRAAYTEFGVVCFI